jgi:Phage Mu protein F like protein
MPDVNPSQLKFQEAINYLADKLNLDTETWIEGQGLTQTVAFTVASAKGQLLQDIRDAVDLAINDGISIAQFAKRFDTIADSYVDNWQLKGDRAWRGQLIYEMALRSSYGAGRYRQLTEPSTLKSRPFWQYVHGDSRVPRPSHLAMDGKVFPAGSLKSHSPFGFNCRCQIFSLSQRDIDHENLTVEDVSDFEADKGFNYLPGKLTKERRDELMKGLDPDIRKLVMGESEAEFKLPEGSTRRRNGINYVLADSRWHRSDNQDKSEKSRVERASDIFELTQQFEHDMEHGSETYESVAERFIHDLMNLGDRDRAEGEVKGMKISGRTPVATALAMSNAVDFCQLLDKPSGVKEIKFEADRAEARPVRGLIDLTVQSVKDSRVTQFHEMAHCAEYLARDTAGKDAEDWVKSRSSGEITLLSKLTGNDRYGDETAHPDSFIDHYVGKLYGDGMTEVHSMGLQAFANPADLADLYKQDPEHFRLMMRFIRK